MYFAGLDAHLKYVTVAVLDRLGTIVLETTVSTREPGRLLAVLAPFRPLAVVVETCPFWPWLYDLLVPAGIGFHLAHAKRLRAIATAPQKNDRVDARLLSGMLLTTARSPVPHSPRVVHLASYAGLAPVTRSPGGRPRHGSIPQGANRWVRGALVSAIPTHVRWAPTSPVTRAYGQQTARLGWRVAQVAAARKLLHIVYIMLRRREPWRGAGRVEADVR